MRRLPLFALCCGLAFSALGARADLRAQTPSAPPAGLSPSNPAGLAGPPDVPILTPRLGPAPALLPDDSAPLLGLNLEEAYRQFGAPASVSSFRGLEAWQDDVVFSYLPGYSLFWFGERLWQIRFQPSYGGSVYGVFLGDPADKVYSLLGSPLFVAEDSLVYRLPYRGFPVRLRIALVGGCVADLYLYRADF